MFCARCATNIADDATSCPVCGLAVSRVAEATPTVIAPAVTDVAVLPVMRGAEPVQSTVRRRRLAVSRRAVVAIVIVGLLVSGGSAWGYITYQELVATHQALQAAQATLASTNDELDRTKGTLRSTSDKLQTTRTSLSKEQEQRAASDRQVATLQRQVAAQVACIQSLTADRQELGRIQGLVIDNYNRRARGSAWAAANAARDTATSNALHDYFQAYSTAFDGFRALANSWIDMGNSELTKASAQLTIMSREVDAMNAVNSQIDGAFSAFATRLQNTNATCGF